MVSRKSTDEKVEDYRGIKLCFSRFIYDNARNEEISIRV